MTVLTDRDKQITRPVGERAKRFEARVKEVKEEWQDAPFATCVEELYRQSSCTYNNRSKNTGRLLPGEKAGSVVSKKSDSSDGTASTCKSKFMFDYFKYIPP